LDVVTVEEVVILDKVVLVEMAVIQAVAVEEVQTFPVLLHEMVEMVVEVK
jgi:hypothetical protein